MFTEQTVLQLVCLSGRGHICLLCKIIKIMSPFGVKFKQACLQPFKDYRFLSSGFFHSDTDLCVCHIHLTLTHVTPRGTWGQDAPMRTGRSCCSLCGESSIPLSLSRGHLCSLPDLWTCSRLACQLASRLKISDLSQLLICRKILKHNVIDNGETKEMKMSVIISFILNFKICNPVIHRYEAKLNIKTS